MQRKTIKNLVNLATFLRLLSPLALFFNNTKIMFICLIIFGVITDGEGIVARKYKVDDLAGRYFDSVADVVAFGIIPVIAYFTYSNFSLLYWLPLFYLFCLSLKEVFIVEEYKKGKRYVKGAPIVFSTFVLILPLLILWNGFLLPIYFLVLGIGFILPIQIVPKRLIAGVVKYGNYSSLDSIR